MSKFKQAFDSVKTVAKNAAAGKGITVSNEIANKRMEVCKDCPAFIKATKQCADCGCFLAVKSKLADMKCPRSLWSE